MAMRTRTRPTAGKRKKARSFEAIARLAGNLPGVQRSTSFGAPALKVDGKMFACVPTHRSAEPDSLVVRIDFPERDELVAADSATFYLKDHYVDYACVLVRLGRIHDDALQDLLQMGWRFMSASRPRVRRRR